MAKPGMVYPSQGELETELGPQLELHRGHRHAVQEIPADRLGGRLCASSKTQLADYDAWVRANVLPQARTDFRLPPEEYALNFEKYGIDIPPARSRR